MKWPFSKAYTARFLVPDLAPRLSKYRAVFIGESPHRDEVKPLKEKDRTPFRGMAGMHWWKAVYQVLGEEYNWESVPPRKELLRVCKKLKIAIVNSVQFPLDPNIAIHEGPASTPSVHLGFEKSRGEWGYLRVYRDGEKPNPVESALTDLQKRLKPLLKRSDKLVSLGNDSKWFATKIIGVDDKRFSVIPHPSSWWRNPDFKKRAIEFLGELKKT